MAFYDFFLNDIVLIVQGLLQLLIVSRSTGKRLRLLESALWLSLFYAGECAVSFFYTDLLAEGLDLCLLWVLGKFFLGNDSLTSGAAAVLAAAAAQFSFGIVDSFTSVLFPGFVGRFWFGAVPLLAACLSLLFCFFCFQKIKLPFLRCFQTQSPIKRLFLPCGVFCLCAETYLLHCYYGQASVNMDLRSAGMNLALFFFQALGLCVLFRVFFAHRRICEGLGMQEKLLFAEQNAEIQKRYAVQARLRYEKTRSLRHDFKNHASVLSGLLQEGDTKRAKDYLDKLKLSVEESSFSVYTGNTVADILLSEKLYLVKKAGAAAEVSLSLPSPGPIEDLDVCIIFSNALDNAVHALQGINGHGFLSVRGIRQGDILLLRFENTCAAGPKPPMGIGLSNIKAAATKYGGTMSYEKSGTRFLLDVLLPLELSGER